MAVVSNADGKTNTNGTAIDAVVNIRLTAATGAAYRGADGLELSVPATAGRKALQKLLYHLLNLSSSDQNTKRNEEGKENLSSTPDFHFLADNEPLRTTLGAFLSRRGRSLEATLSITYYIPLPEPQLKNKAQVSPGWLSSVAAMDTSQLRHGSGERESAEMPLVLVGTYSGSVALYRHDIQLIGDDVFSKKCGRHDAAVKAVAWMPSNTQFVTASLDQTIKLWQTESPPGTSNPSSATFVAEFRSENAGGPLAFHSVATENNLMSTGGDRAHIAAGADDGSIWALSYHADLLEENPVNTIGHAESLTRGIKRRRATPRSLVATRVGASTIPVTVTGLAWSNDGELISTGLDGFIRVWDATDCKLSTTVPCGHKSILAMSLGGTLGGTGEKRNLVAVAAADGAVRVVDASGSGMIAACGSKGAHDGLVNAVTWIHGNRNIASGGVDGSVRLWDVRAMAMPVRIVRNIHGGQSCTAITAASRDGSHILYSVGADGKLVTLEFN